MSRQQFRDQLAKLLYQALEGGAQASQWQCLPVIVNYHPNGATHYRLNGATYGCSRRMLKLRYDFTTFPLGVSFARVSATGLASSGRGFGAR